MINLRHLSRSLRVHATRVSAVRSMSTVPWKLATVTPFSNTVPSHIDCPPYIVDPNTLKQPKEFNLKTEEEIALMRVSGKIASQIRSYAGFCCKVGRTTDEIDRMVHDKVVSLGVYPSPLGYSGFPKSCCTSINQVICHGIPDARPLEDGDIINIDVSVWIGGFHGDCSATFLVGNVSEEDRKLVEVTKESLEKSTSICAPGVPIKQIGHTIHDVADIHGFGVVRDFCGHGIGRQFHQLPDILHYRNDYQGHMVQGMVFTIEPMLTLGDITTKTLEDGWTVVTTDERSSAQFEDTMVITEDGVEVLTKHDEEVF